MDPQATGTPTGPAWIASPKRLAKLRERARLRQTIRDLCMGEHRRVFAEVGIHRFGKVLNNMGQLNDLIAMFNLVDLAPGMLAATLVGTPPMITTDDGFDEQARSIAVMRSESMFDALSMRLVRKAAVDGEVMLRVQLHPRLGHIPAMEAVDICLPVGPDGPDMQPTVYERRWFLRKTVGRREARFLFVERHRVDERRGAIVENELYVARGNDQHADLTKLKRVPLAAYYGEEAAIEEVIELGLDRNTIARVVHNFDDEGWPRLLLDQSDIGMTEVYAAALSRLARTMEQHGKPKIRISEEMIDLETGKADLSSDTFVDPEKIIEFIPLNFDFAGMTAWMTKNTQMLLTRLGVPPALLGIKLEGGAMPDSYDKLRLESTNLMVRAKTAQPYIEAAFEHTFWVASMMEARLPFRGWPVGEVNAALSPAIPSSEQDRARDMGERMRDGTIDELSALEELYGTERGLLVYERLQAQRDTQTRLEQARVFGAMTGGVSA